MKKSIVLLLPGLFFIALLNGQEDSDMDTISLIRNQDTLIFTLVEQMPKFPGGEEARIKYLSEYVIYPQEARENGIQGTVYTRFVVEADGSITNVEVVRGIGGGCDEEAVRLISGMPKWEPGYQLGKPVRVQFMMPIKFRVSVMGAEGYPVKSNYDLGVERMNFEMYEKAIKSFDQTIKNKEENYKEAYCNRGICYYQLGEYNLAAEDLMKAQNVGAELDNNHVAIVMYLVANEFLIQNKLPQAINMYSRALELNPDDARTYYNRGLAFERNGDEIQAKSDWKNARKLGFEIPKN